MINVDNIGKVYGANDFRTVALQSVSCQIDSGEMVALCGPSGSGKSTLLNILGLLDTSYSGSVKIDDKEVSKIAGELTKIRREKLGFIFQSYNLISVMTAYENIEYPLLLVDMTKAERVRRVSKFFDLVGLSGHEGKLPDKMSGGQQQRVAIARALIKKPSLVIADEPTANLDTTTANAVIALMKNIGDELGTTFVVATHDERMSGQCDRVIRMQDGHIVIDGSGENRQGLQLLQDDLTPVAGGLKYAVD